MLVKKKQKVRDGYILYVANQSENSFQLIDKINVGGKNDRCCLPISRAN
jgi:hypothetical protein